MQAKLVRGQQKLHFAALLGDEFRALFGGSPPPRDVACDSCDLIAAFENLAASHYQVRQLEVPRALLVQPGSGTGMHS